MLHLANEKFLAKVLAFGSAFIALFVITGTVTDPVNVTKHFALGGVAAAAIAIAIAFGSKTLWQEHKTEVIFAGLFLLASINAIINSSGPLVQNLYGVYGRNTAFVAYFLLLLVFISSLLLRSPSSFDLLIWGLLIAGFVNVLYSGWALMFGDFIPWNNPYGNILGTFGNPNFIGAFFGFFAAALVAFAFKKSWKIWQRVAAIIVFGITCVEIVLSNAIQGRVVVAAGIAIVGFYLIRSYFKSNIFSFGYVILVGIMGVFALLGALQKGPLAQYIYKTSVSLRGEYWQAGWNMTAGHQWTGVGFDTYGDWYRRARDTQALILPGPNVTTNTAHNVPIDILATGGWPLFIPYMAFIVLAIIAIIKITLRNRDFDPTFVALTTAWAGFQLQSIISINQIGLAVWGWLFTGALIAYERATRKTTPIENSEVKRTGRARVKSQASGVVSPQIIALIGAVVGLIIACPPYSADSKWRQALTSNNALKVEEALVPSYLNPLNSYKLASASQLLEGSKLYDLAHKYALKAVEFNPNHFESWRLLYIITNSTAEEKAKALENMKRLDPNNPNPLSA
jgi:O-antigen ligase